MGNHLSDPKLANVSNILTKEPFKSEWLDEQSEQIPWHKTFQKEKKYDIFNLHTIWNKTAVRYVFIMINLKVICISWVEMFFKPLNIDRLKMKEKMYIQNFN